MTASSVRLRTVTSDTEAISGTWSMNSLPTLANRELTSQLFLKKASSCGIRVKDSNTKRGSKSQELPAQVLYIRSKRQSRLYSVILGRSQMLGHCGAWSLAPEFSWFFAYQYWRNQAAAAEEFGLSRGRLAAAEFISQQVGWEPTTSGNLISQEVGW